MTGLDKILETVTAQGDEKINKLLFEADSKAQAMSEQIYSAARADCEKTLDAAEKRRIRNIESARSAAKSISARQVLETKSRLIDEAAKSAKEKIISMKNEDYFSLMYRLLSSHLHSGKGVIVFNKRDRAAVDGSFLKKAASLREGASLELSDKCADISGGFILIYGEIEENCSLEALENEKRDEIRDRAAEILFGKGEK